MGRNILAAVGGYVVMVIVVMAGIGVAWTILGGGGAFDGEGPRPSTAWMAGNIVTGFIAAFAGGWAARKMGTSATAATILIGLVLVLGVISAVAAMGTEAQPLGKPVADLTFFEAGAYAAQPAWYNWLMPAIGAIGVWLGGGRAGGAR